MKVLVTGGTGFVGTALCAELVDRGHEVTALARNPDEATLPAGVETEAGDVTDYESMEGAFEGQDAVVNLVAASPLFEPPDGERQHFGIHVGGTENVVRAAEAHDVDRLVQQSALGADPEGSTHYIRAKGEAERVVRQSELDWTIFRPSIIFGDGGEFVGFTKLLTTPYVTGLPGGGKTRFQPIWVEDFVPMVAEALADETHVGETYEIGGPEVLTLADVTRLVYRAEGKSVSILPIPMVLAKAGLTVAGVVPLIPFGPDQAAALEFDNTVVSNDLGAFGVDPADLRTLGEYLGVGERP